ncbi:MAG: bifunctional adenosylcobinamide kinase/adenosylcobinamide-phosphate guanylyltransferase, partial [Pseudomonadota bacterium]
MTAHKNTLILGGARSGKSRFALEMAQDLARSAGARPGMIATAQAFDSEMEERIARHKAERGPEWLNAEESLDIAAALASFPADCGAVVVDCLTLWLSNIMHHDRDVEAETAALVAALEQAQMPILLVSNEVGLG